MQFKCMTGNRRQEVNAYKDGRNSNEKKAKRFLKITTAVVRTFSNLPKSSQEKKSFHCHCHLSFI